MKETTGFPYLRNVPGNNMAIRRHHLWFIGGGILDLETFQI